MKDFPALETSRCVLNCITDDDVPVLRQIFDDESTQKYLPELQSLVRTDKGIQQMLSSFDAYLTMGEGVMWGVRLRDVMIGFVAIMDLSCNPTIIYAMHPSYRSNGYMKECVTIVMDYLQDTGLCKTIQTEVYPDNYISKKILIDVGFIPLMQEKKKKSFKFSFENSSNCNH